jgi:heme-degrading monooxygenase HmoA
MTLSSPQSTAIAIVRVKSPWWAPRFLITGRFIDSIPEYAGAPGLLHKAYTFSEAREFGGVYLWDSRASAEEWFNEKWHQRVKRVRGVDGDVRILDVKYSMTGASTPIGRELPLHGLRTDAVVTWLASRAKLDGAHFEALATAVPLADGLVRVSLVTQADGTVGVVSLWTSRAAAATYWSAARRAGAAKLLGETTLSWFDAPVLLDAAQAKNDLPANAHAAGVTP